MPGQYRRAYSVRVAFLALVVGCATSAQAIILRAWTFEELAAASDAVLVVERVSVRNTGRRTPWPLPGSRFQITPTAQAVEWEAELTVLLQLKPDALAKTPVGPKIRFRYYRIDAPKGIINGPFEIDLTTDKGSYYLVFLKRVAGDQFEPASKDDQAIDSVFSLEHTGGRRIRWDMYLPSSPPPSPR